MEPFVDCFCFHSNPIWFWKYQIKEGVIYSSFQTKFWNTLANHVNCLWCERIDCHCCFMNFELNSAQRKINFQTMILFLLEFQLLWAYRVLPIILWFLKVLTCPHLGTSCFGHPHVFQKRFFLDTALKMFISTWKCLWTLNMKKSQVDQIFSVWGMAINMLYNFW